MRVLHSFHLYEKKMDWTTTEAPQNGDFKHNDPDILEMEAILHNSKLKSSFSCDECEFETDREALIVLHLKEHSLSEAIDQTLTMKISNTYSLPSPLKCPHCPFESTSKGNLKLHSFMHEDQIFSCSLCDYKTNFEKLLMMHEETHKRKEEKSHGQVESGKISCSYCSYVAFKKRSMLNHLRMHLKCRLCGFKAVDMSELEMHDCEGNRDSEGQPKLWSVRCPVCRLRVDDRFELGHHMNSHLKPQKRDRLELDHHLNSQKCENNVKDQYRQANIKCPLCNFVANNRIELAKHMNLHLDTQVSPLHKYIHKDSQKFQRTSFQEEDSQDSVSSEANSEGRKKSSWSLDEKREIYWCHLFSRHKVFPKTETYKRQLNIMKARGVIDSEKMTQVSFSKLLGVANHIKRSGTVLKQEELKEIESDVNKYVRHHLQEFSSVS